MISLSVTTETLLAEVFGRYSEERGRGSNIVSVEHWRAHRIHGTGIFTYIYHKNQPNVDKYTIHGSYGYLINLDLFGTNFSGWNFCWILWYPFKKGERWIIDPDIGGFQCLVNMEGSSGAFF